MPLVDIHHVALKCKRGNLEATEKFYAEFLGMTYAPRPDIGFAGAGLDIGDTMVHLVEKEDPEELDPWYRREESASSVDHIAIKAHGFDEMKQKAMDGAIDWRQMSIPAAGLWQLFFLDPNGVIIELNFPIAEEPAGSVGPGTDKLYPPLEEQSAEAQARTKKLQDSQAAE